MGTDIHVVLQSHVNGKWITQDKMSVDRSYLLFGILADVRGCQLMAGPIADPRGLPEDFSLDEAVRDLGIDPDSWMAQEDWVLGYHDRSWLTVKEIVEYPGWDELLDSHSARYYCGWFLVDLEEAAGSAPGSDHRIVFGFDS